MQDIASAAGYTPPTLYAYFSGKEDILRSLIDDLSDDLIRAIEGANESRLNFEQRLELLLDRHREVAESHRAAVVFVLRLGPKGESDLPDDMQKDRYQRRMVQWMRSAQKETKELTDMPATVLATALTSLCEGFLCDWAQRGGRQPLAKLFRQVKLLFLNGVRGAD